MKIWLRIAIVTFLIAGFSNEVLIRLVERTVIREITKLHGEKLKSIAVTIAIHLSETGYPEVVKDFHEKNFDTSQLDSLRRNLIRIKNRLELNEEIYTLNMLNDSTAIFILMTNSQPFVGDTLHLLSETALHALNKVWKNCEAQRTDLYQDQHGVWISGMAPIIDNKGECIGIVELDHESDFVFASLDKFNSELWLFRILLFFLSFGIIFLVVKYLMNPVEKTTKLIEAISLGNYDTDVDIKGSGEVKQLLQSVDRMKDMIGMQRKKILEQLENLRLANLESEKLNKLKSNILHLISHELRTPLSGISIIEITMEEFQTLKIENSEEHIAFQEQLEILHDSYKRLTNFVEKILLYLEYAADKLNYHRSEVIARDLFAELVPMYSSKYCADKNSCVFENSLESEVIVIDNEKLSFVIDAFLSNAVKYGADNKFHVKVCADKENLQFEVLNTGKPLNSDMVVEIFDPFISSDILHHSSGSGVSLAICKIIIDKHFGKIKAQPLEKGAQFSFTIPLKK